MPVYTSQQLRHNAIQSPEYVQRELQGLTTGRLEDIHVVGRPEQMQPHYPQYVANLSAFLTATALQKKVTCGGAYFFTIDPRLLIPLTLPPLTIAPIKPFQKEEDENAFLAKLPGTVNTTVYLKRKCYVLSNLTAEQIAKLPASDPNVPSSTDSVSLSGMRQYLTTMKILTMFLSTHTYPAYQTDEDLGTEYSADQDIHVITDRSSATSDFRGQSSYYPKNIAKKIMSCKVGVDESLINYPSDESTWSYSGTVSVAKPAPLYPNVNYGPPSAIPSLPGFLFPYFHGMIFPSESSIISIMRRFFLAAFGNVSEDKDSRWSAWVKSVSKWHRTEGGMVLSHIFYCLQTAIECQGRLFVVMSSGKYLGSAILGYKFSVSVDGVLVSADSHEALLKSAADLDEHTKALHEIERILKGLTLIGDDDISMDQEIDGSSPRALHKDFVKRVVPSEEVVENLTKLVKRLTFHQKYWSISGESLEKALRFLVSDESIPEDWPMYLDPLMMFDSSRIFEVLSAFGPLAPSMIDAGGVDVKIPEGISASDPDSMVADGESSIRRPKLYVTGKKLYVACNDMRGVMNKRKIRQNTSERAAGYRTITLAGKQRDMVWTALKMIPFVDNSAKGKNKRVAEDDGVQGAKRQAKDRETEEALGDF